MLVPASKASLQNQNSAGSITSFDPCLRLVFEMQLSPQLWHRLCQDAASRRCHPLDLALAQGHVDEERFLATLARLLGCPFTAQPPAPVGRLLPDEAFLRRGYRSFAPGGTCQVMAPNGTLGAMLLRRYHEGRLPTIILTREQCLLGALTQWAGKGIGERAASSVPGVLSARTLVLAPKVLAGLLIAFAMIMVSPLVTNTPFALGGGVLLALTPVYGVAAIASLTAALTSGAGETEPESLPDGALPGYTILVPLFRERRVVRQLISRLATLDYPPEKRQVLLLVEHDDPDTLAGLAELQLPPGFLVFPVPPGLPRTKPRALNAALPFARGQIITVFDAEDDPESDQLKKAATAFAYASPELACLQARLAISNPDDHWLCQRFAQDYAALFECTRSGLALAGWPVALGGTSNHFRLDSLRAVGGWDAANVTEDADLGYRLALKGHQVGVLDSTTWEEAPNSWPIWRNQRIRWLKGWFQTALVHRRHFRAYWHQLGLLPFIVGLCVPVAMLATALLLPLFVVLAGFRLLSGAPFGGQGVWQALLDTNMIMLLGMGILTEAVPILIALRRRGWLPRWPWLLLTPLTQGLVSLCAWVALWELIKRPHYWRKTPHGLARSSIYCPENDQKQRAHAAVIISPKTATPFTNHSHPAPVMKSATMRKVSHPPTHEDKSGWRP